LLQELRVLQTGVQILAGFLLTLPFQQRFERLDGFQVTLYLVNVVIAALTTAFILLPVSVHRRLFRQRLKATLVSSADTITKLALAGVAMLSVGTAALVFDVTAGRSAGLTAGGILLAVLLVLLVLVPMRLNRRARGR
jgi:glucan phosphoethanolaminetransferase (alkaline phosphatase superfamily)